MEKEYVVQDLYGRTDTALFYTGENFGVTDNIDRAMRFTAEEADQFIQVSRGLHNYVKHKFLDVKSVSYRVANRWRLP